MGSGVAQIFWYDGTHLGGSVVIVWGGVRFENNVGIGCQMILAVEL